MKTLNLQIKNQRELDAVISALESYADITSDMNCVGEYTNEDGVINEDEFHKAIAHEVNIHVMKERVLCLNHLRNQLPK